MKYIGNFSSIFSEYSYNVTIVTDSDESTTKTITMSGEDTAIIKYEGDDENIYKPVKYSSATIRFLTDSDYFDLYAKTAQEDKVIIYDQNSKIYWKGYTTPNAYSNGYERDFEIKELECIDGLSTLKYFDYVPLSGTKDIVNLYDVLFYILNKCGCYDGVVIQQNISFDTATTATCLITNCLINEQNFFDEDNKAMKLDEVLENICKFFNLTCFASRNNIYLVDYDVMFHPELDLRGFYFDLKNYSKTPTIISFPSAIWALNQTTFRENGQTISLDNIYNKVILHDSLYSYDSIIPEVFDDEYLTNYNGDFVATEKVDFANYGNEKYFNRYYYSSKYNCYCSNNMEGTSFRTNNDKTHFNTYSSAVVGSNCSTILKSETYHYSDEDKDKIINKLSLNDYICISRYNSDTRSVSDPYWNNYSGQIAFDTSISLPKQLIGGKDTYIVINCSQILNEMTNKIDPFISQIDNVKRVILKSKYDQNMYNLRCILKIGDYYFNNDNYSTDKNSGTWQKTPTTFCLHFNVDFQDKTNINVQGQEISVENNISYDDNLNCEGYKIKMNNVINGQIYFAIYFPQIDNYQQGIQTYIKDFEIKSVIANPEKKSSKNDDTDTKYENIINENYVSEKELDDWKICTYDGKSPSYSVVAYTGGGEDNTIMLDSTYNEVTKKSQRMEQHAIEKQVNQYSTPSVIFDFNLKNSFNFYDLFYHENSKKIFVLDSCEINLRNDEMSAHLVEKK